MREGGFGVDRFFTRQAAILVPLGLVIGLALAHFGGGHVAQALLAVAGLTAVLVVMAGGPLRCLLVVTFLAVLGWSPTLIAVGAIDLTPLDIFYLALVVALAIDYLRRSEAGEVRDSRRGDVGQRAVWVFVLLLGLGILAIYRRDPGSAGGALVSWIRLAQTMTLMSLVPAVVKTRDEVSTVVKVVALAGALSVVLAIVGLGGGRDVLTGIRRAGTFLSPNVVGLLSAVLVVLVLHSPLPSNRRARAGLALVAVVGLITAKSLASFIALALVLTLAGFSSKRIRSGVREHALLPMVLRVLAVAVVAIDLALVLRPESLPGRLEFSSSSTMHRVLVGTAGLEIFKRHPVIGVGWQQSSTEEYIGDPELNRDLRRRFPDASPHLFPDVSATSVHNFYIQTLAEAGITGFIVLGWAILVTSRRMRVLLRELQEDEWGYRQARFLALTLLLIVVWLNENPLFGGQTPSMLIVVALGLAGALARSAWQTSSPAPDSVRLG